MLGWRNRMPVYVGALVAVLSLTGCEPDECEVVFEYITKGRTNRYELSSGAGTCGFIGYSIDYDYEVSSVQLDFLSEFKVGVQPVMVRYIDLTGTQWYSSPDAFGGCVAALESVELVDWVIEDHYRIRGVVSCPLPLTDSLTSLGTTNELVMTSFAFEIYAGQFGDI